MADAVIKIVIKNEVPGLFVVMKARIERGFGKPNSAAFVIILSSFLSDPVLRHFWSALTFDGFKCLCVCAFCQGESERCW